LGKRKPAEETSAQRCGSEREEGIGGEGERGRTGYEELAVAFEVPFGNRSGVNGVLGGDDSEGTFGLATRKGGSEGEEGRKEGSKRFSSFAGTAARRERGGERTDHPGLLFGLDL
jgi:hypothetical protein